MSLFQPAVRKYTPMIIGISGATGTGKTYTALTLAMGLAGDGGRIAMCDTEGGRGLHYADLKDGKSGKPLFRYDHLNMKPKYEPKAFLAALDDAQREGYSVVVVDSFSDEYEGTGGLIEMKDEEEKRLHNSVAAWAKPKAEHKKVMNWLRQSRMHVIFCMRAEDKVAIVKVPDKRTGKETTEVVPVGWQSVCEKRTMFEMTTSFMLKPDDPKGERSQPGVPHFIKLQEQHKDMFPPNGSPITREVGVKLGKWCAGGVALEETPTVADETTEEEGDFDDFGLPPLSRDALIAGALEEAHKGVAALKTYCEGLRREGRWAEVKEEVMRDIVPIAKGIEPPF